MPVTAEYPDERFEPPEPNLFDSDSDYMYAMECYTTELERAVLALRGAVRYAVWCIDTDIPSFESVLHGTSPSVISQNAKERYR